MLRAVQDAAPELDRYLDTLAARLSGLPGEDEALRIAAQWGEDLIADDQQLAGHLWRADAMCHLAGQQFVRRFELPRSLRLSLEGAPPPTFLNLRFDEAIRAFEELELVDPDEVDALLEAERRRAFFLTRSVSRRMTELAQRRIRESFEPDGPQLGEFVAELEGGVDGAGFPGGARRYLETVFRTTTASSYNAGRYRQQTDPDVIEAGGVWEYLTADDVRVRSTHRALDGKQWQMGDPDGRRAYPPNGFNCRCVVVVVDPEDASAEALAREVDVDAAITDGFDGAPGDVIEG